MKTEKWVQTSEADKAHNQIYIKRLALVEPNSRVLEEYDDFKIEEPTLISYTHYVDTPLVFKSADQVIELPTFKPSRWVGVSFDAIHPAALTNGSLLSHEVQDWSWVTFLEPIGRLYTQAVDRIEDYRLAKAVKVKEIRAYCYRCIDEAYPITLDNPKYMDEPLKEGVVVDAFAGCMGEGLLKAVCSLEKHPMVASIAKYNFQLSEEGLKLSPLYKI